jgi:hypothetical protein
LPTSFEDERVSVPAPDGEVAGLRKDDRKKAKELELFTSFVSASGISIDPQSAKNAGPPRPDISGTVNGTLRWFELGEIIGNDVAEKINPPSEV